MNLLGIVKLRIIAAVWEQLFFNTIRFWTIVTLLGIVKLRVIAAVWEQFFFNTIRSWTLVNLLGDCEVEGNCCCMGTVFF